MDKLEHPDEVEFMRRHDRMIRRLKEENKSRARAGQMFDETDPVWHESNIHTGFVREMNRYFQAEQRIQDTELLGRRVYLLRPVAIPIGTALWGYVDGGRDWFPNRGFLGIILLYGWWKIGSKIDW